MKKSLALLLTLTMIFALAACGGQSAPAAPQTPAEEAAEQPAEEAAPAEESAPAEEIELIVFAAASMTETLTKIKDLYEAANPGVKITYNFDSSGTLKTQIQEGAECDLFISAGKSGDVLMAMGNSDVPVGQYTQKILAYYDLSEDELAAAGKITYGSNVKEVTTQVSEASVDCGVVYCTDAFSAGLTVVEGATAEMCGQVIYPAAVLNVSTHPEAAQSFLDYLTTDEAMAVFEAVGFSPAA